VIIISVYSCQENNMAWEKITNILINIFWSKKNVTKNKRENKLIQKLNLFSLVAIGKK